jgi:hypothetical protein
LVDLVGPFIAVYANDRSASRKLQTTATASIFLMTFVPFIHAIAALTVIWGQPAYHEIFPWLAECIPKLHD